MKRPTDKQLHDAIEACLGFDHPTVPAEVREVIAYAQLLALERLADNVFNLTETLAVIRADHKPKEPK